MNYEEMSDLQINQAVTCEVHGCQMWGVNKDGSFYHCGVLGDAYIHQPIVDYCNNPSDAWPIIDKYNICIHNDEMEGRSHSCTFDKFGYVGKESYCDNTLRAAMIVFLMMQEDEQ